MPHVLHLYNVLGAMTERAWLDYPLALAGRGYATTFACERVAEDAPRVAPRVVRLERIAVGPTHDMAAQMRAVAAATGGNGSESGRESAGDSGKRELLNQRIDLVHGHFGPRLLHAAAWLTRGIPVVISLYGYDASRLLRDPAWVDRYRWAAERGAVFVVLCEAMRRRLIALGVPADRVRIVHLGVEPETFAYAPQPRSGPEASDQGACESRASDAPRFLFVGRLTPTKAPGDLIAALAHLRDQYDTPATLDLIGEGPLEPALRARIVAAGLNNVVRLLGSMPRDQVARHMRSADALVLPSVTASDGDEEGTPVVLMEATARGLPCITTRHAGNPDVVPPLAHDLELVTAPADPAALAAAMHRLITLPPVSRRRLQDAGREHFRNHYTLAATVAGYDGLYRELLHAK